MVKQDFDHIATQYDNTFTHTLIGKAQRDQVYKFLDVEVSNWERISILELNAGTGEDAFYFAKRGAKVCATDISSQMVKVGTQKTIGESVNLIFETLSIVDLAKFNTSEKYDLIFSNFGGLNCVSPSQFEEFIEAAYLKLTPNGNLIMVVMSKFSFWEAIYFFIKLKWGKIFRRSTSKPIKVNVEGKEVKTWYYSPKQLLKWGKINGFSTKKPKPIGFFLPPSYLNPYFEKRKRFFKKLIKWESKIENSSFCAARADHYFVVLSKQGKE